MNLKQTIMKKQKFLQAQKNLFIDYAEKKIDAQSLVDALISNEAQLSNIDGVPMYRFGNDMPLLYTSNEIKTDLLRGPNNNRRLLIDVIEIAVNNNQINIYI